MTMQGQTLPPPPLPPPPRQPPTTQIPIPSSVLQAVYASDQEMYPVALSYSRLRAWVEACPDLSICFQNSTAPTGEESAAAAAGVVIVLPLKRVYWEDLLVGRLKEPEIEPEEMFPACGEGCHGEDEGEGEREEVGLHVYHIERFGSWTEGAGGGVGRKGFARFALEEVMRRVRAEKGWKVVGWSALTATPAGRRTFEKLGFLPTGYKELFVASVSQDGTGKQPLEMVCQFPGEQNSPEMNFSTGSIVSMSEMAVKHGDLLDLV